MKKQVSDLNIFAQKWSKIAAAKKVFFTDFFLHLFTLFKHLFAPASQSPMSKFLDFHRARYIFEEFCLTSRIFCFVC